MESIILNNKLECPVVGIGTFMLSPADAENSVREALKMGYRPNIFVMDSPILSLKEDVDASELASDSMKSSLFKYFINHPCAEQIIIIENEVPKLDYSGVKMRKFSKGNGFWKTDPTTYQA